VENCVRELPVEEWSSRRSGAAGGVEQQEEWSSRRNGAAGGMEQENRAKN
jgi:hypothetical protein